MSNVKRLNLLTCLNHTGRIQAAKGKYVYTGSCFMRKFLKAILTHLKFTEFNDFEF